MKKPLFLLFTGLLLSCLIPVHTVAAQELPTQKETLENIIKVNDYFMKKYADYTTPSFYGRVRPSNIWTRGVYYEGLMALYSTNGECATAILPVMRTTIVADRRTLISIKSARQTRT